MDQSSLVKISGKLFHLNANRKNLRKYYFFVFFRSVVTINRHLAVEDYPPWHQNSSLRSLNPNHYCATIVFLIEARVSQTLYCFISAVRSKAYAARCRFRGVLLLGPSYCLIPSSHHQYEYDPSSRSTVLYRRPNDESYRWIFELSGFHIFVSSFESHVSRK